MAQFFDEVKANVEMTVDGVRYMYQYREIRKRVGNAWALIARLTDGKWEIRRNGKWEVL